ncbi:unnamed protein product [Gordionus sp. m RMFG-2023]|uniref:mitochondrial ornithine transporter 1-like n=1 Tax=Gordionus sp. m RMFG-2023 TaxID=3053472 RepID=UPI0030E0F9F1
MSNSDLKPIHQLPHLLDATIDFVSGSLGAVASVYVGQPLDTVKVKMQTFSDIYKTGSLDCFRKTLKNQGIKGLYAGTAPALLANVAENSVLFSAYGLCQKVVYNIYNHPSLHLHSTKPYFVMPRIDKEKEIFLKSPPVTLTPLGNASAGAMAAIFSTFVLCPTELIKCRIQAYQENNPTALSNDALTKHKSINISPNALNTIRKTELKVGPWYITKQIYLNEGGLPAFFKGLGPTFGREVPGYFCFFGGYELTRSLLIPPGKTKNDIGVLGTIFSGGIGGVCLWLAVFPFDVIKSRMQVLKDNNKFLPVLKVIIKQQGFRGLYKGLGPTLLRTFPASGALFLTYQLSQEKLQTTSYKFLF